MKRVVSYSFGLCFVFLIFFTLSTQVSAQYSCGSCCLGSTRTCSDIACTLGCADNPSCTVGAVSGLTATDMGTYANFNWTEGVNIENSRIVIKEKSTGNVLVAYDYAHSKYPDVVLTPGVVYTWTVTPRNTCYTGSTVTGPDIALQVACSSCCEGSTRTCSDIACTLDCVNTPSCTLGAPGGLSYVGNNNLTATLSWTAATNANGYIVRMVRDDGSVFVNNVETTELTYTTAAMAKGHSYTWSVTPKHNCGSGAATNGPMIGVPNQTGSTGAVVINGSGSPTCTDSGCNGQDLIVSYDGNHNQIVPFSVTFTDLNPSTGNRFTDIETAYILFDNNLDASSSQYRLIYTDNADGTYTLVEDNPSGAYGDYISLTGVSRSRNTAHTILTLNFSLDLNSLPRENQFLTNIYLNAYDFSGLVTGRAIKVGTGDFTDPPADPYTGAAANALDVWNGKDVLVGTANYYKVVNYTTVCSQSGLPEALTLDLTGSYSPAIAGFPGNLTTWDTTSYYQPYYYYNGGNYQVTYTPTDSSYYITGMSSERFGGNCAQGDGTVTNIFKNGGSRVDDSGVGDRTLQMAFAVLPVAGHWTNTTNGGSYFANSNIGINIEPLTCTGCFFTTAGSMDTNGLLLVNGDIVATTLDYVGSPNNWYAKTQSSTQPFTNFDLPSFDELKELYGSASYVDLSGNQTTGVGSLASVTLNSTYFINGNLTINNSMLQATTGNYLIFIVNGNITITNAVMDSAGVSAIKAVLIALDNGNGTGNITIQDDDTNENDALTIEGSLAAAGTITFGRDLYINNNYGPATTIYFRPDMLEKMKTDNVPIVNLQKILVSQY